MKTPLPFAPASRLRFAPFEFKRLGIFLLFLSAIARAVDTPVLVPDGGTFTTFQSVTVSCATPGADLRYTTNGADPTMADSSIVSGNQVEVRTPLTLKVKAFLNAEVALKSAAYNITGHVSTSGSHTLVLRADGTVWATGLNSSGQLGDGTTINRILLTQVPGLSDVVAVAAGGSHSLALMRDGTVKAWGSNTGFQCGTPGITPHAVSGLANVTAIAAGQVHSVARTSVNGGSVYTWGGGFSGQQGNGTTSSRATPGLVLSGVKDIACGGGSSHTLALMNGGTVKNWGSNTSGQCGGYPSYSPVSTPVDAPGLGNIIAIAAGSGHSVAVKSDGTVFGWGESFYSYGYQPGLIAGFSNIKTVVAGSGFTLALTNANTVVGLGNNSFGGLGIGAVAWASPPVALTSPASVAVIAAGGNCSIAIRPNGNVFAWGSNANGALGFGTATQKNVPIQLLSENIPDVNSIAAGGSHNLISHADINNHANDTLLAWGSNSSGELGANNLMPCTEPCLIPGVTPLFSPTSAPIAAAGIDFSLVLRANGTVAAAGQNTYGVLGSPSSISRSTTFIPVGGLANIGSIAAGRSHALAVNNTTGQVFAWGYGVFGQLGNGTSTISQYSPVPVSNLTNVSGVAAGQYHSIARKTDGTVWAWGYSSYVGNTTSTDKKIPNQVGLTPSGGTPLTNVISIAAGLSHNVAARGDGTVAAWGSNSEGQLGDNTTIPRTTPVTVQSSPGVAFAGVVRVAAGYAHSLALKNDGTVWAWGRNVEGQLGDASNTQRNVPVQVVGLSGIVAIAAGDYHNLALKADGGVASWGANNLDQLGTGLSTAQLTALIVPGINVLHGAPGVTIIQPSPDTYALDEPFKLAVTLTPTDGNPVARVAYLNEGYPIPSAISLGTEAPPFSITLALDTWGDFHISATASDLNDTPSFPSPPVLIHIPPPITLTVTQASINSVQLNWFPIPPNNSTSYRVERRLPGGTPTILASAIGGLSYLDSGAAYQPEYLYRVSGFKGTGTLKTALSVEVPLHMTNDFDHDGMLDAWELANGFDPYNAADAALDADTDGISNLLESRYGLDPHHTAIQDTDGTHGVSLTVLTPIEAAN